MNIIQGAVEDTRWLRASSRREMELFLSDYYTGPLLAKVVNSAWSFVVLPTDWTCTARVEKYRAIVLMGGRAVVLAEIVESDPALGLNFSTEVKYSLVRTEKGWRINQSRPLPAPGT